MRSRIMEFQNQKLQRLEHVDLSRKGSVDEPILDLVRFINSLPNYFTTSSCSGRIIVFKPAFDDDNSGADKPVGTQMKIGKKGCKWVFVTHSTLTSDDLGESLDKVTSCSGNAVFKFEAMVMHVQCQSVEDAQKMHQAAMAAGFRNSGISIGGKKKIILGVRSTHGLEAPLTKDGRMLVTPEYYEHLAECANNKMEENVMRINRFFDNVKLMAEKDSNDSREKDCKKGKRSKKKEAQLVSGDGKKSSRQKGNGGTSCDEDNSNNSSVMHCGDAVANDEDELSLFMFEDT